ncbi:MAG: TonB-dependent receptor [Bacteroidetes bacterium]|nr:TonB-dependent receptor [Bacteroidota bacterium]
MKLPLSFILLFVFNLAFSQTQDSSLYSIDQIEITSFYNEINPLSAPSHISVLNKKSIQRRNSANISDILKTVLGVYVKSYGNSSSLQTISINGLGAEHTVILLNGSKLNSIQNGQTDLSLIPAGDIQKIEVMNNGFSSMYGSDAMGGVVNIITDDVSSKKLNVKAGGEIGSYNFKKYLFKISNSFKKLKYHFSLTSEKSDNDYKFYFDDGTNIELRNKSKSAFEISNYSLNSEYLLGKNSALSYYAQFVNSYREVPGVETGNTPPNTVQLDKNWNNILKYSFQKKNITFTSDFNYQNNLMNYNTYPVLLSYYKNILLASLNKVEINSKNNSFNFGNEIQYAALYSNELNDNINRKHYAIFASSKIVINNLSFFPSVRYDYISDIKTGAVTYQFGLNYKPFEKINLHLRGNVSRNFAAPTFNGLYWKSWGNPDLKPEYSQNYEAGFIFSGKNTVDYTFDFSYMNVEAVDRIVWLPQRYFIWKPFNVGKSKSEIFMSDGKINFELKDFSVSLSLSYTRSSSKKTSEDFPNDPSSNKQIIYIPDEQTQSSFSASLKNFGINLFHTYTGKRYSDTENLSPMNSVNSLDGNIFYDLKISDYSASFKFEINNITNSDYQLIAGYPAPLRNYTFKINLNYSF